MAAKKKPVRDAEPGRPRRRPGRGGPGAAPTEVVSFAKRPPRQAGTISPTKVTAAPRPPSSSPRRSSSEPGRRRRTPAWLKSWSSPSIAGETRQEGHPRAADPGPPAGRARRWCWAARARTPRQERLAEYGAAKVYVADSDGLRRLRRRAQGRAAGRAGRAGQPGRGAGRRAPPRAARSPARLAVKTGSGLITDAVGAGRGRASPTQVDLRRRDRRSQSKVTPGRRSSRSAPTPSPRRPGRRLPPRPCRSRSSVSDAAKRAKVTERVVQEAGRAARS